MSFDNKKTKKICVKSFVFTFVLVSILDSRCISGCLQIFKADRKMLLDNVIQLLQQISDKVNITLGVVLRPKRYKKSKGILSRTKYRKDFSSSTNYR